MQPEIHLGPVTLQTFGIMFALGFIAAGLLVARRLKELGKPVDWAYELVFAALVGGVVGLDVRAAEAAEQRRSLGQGRRRRFADGRPIALALQPAQEPAVGRLAHRLVGTAEPLGHLAGQVAELLHHLPKRAAQRTLAARIGGGTATREGIAGHFFSGLFATLMATPCSAPFLGTAIGFALAQKAGLILAIFTGVGFGMALPYLLLAAAPGVARYFPRPGAWMDTVRGAMTRLARTRWLEVRTPAARDQAWQEHRAVLDALEARDADTAARLLTGHIRGTNDRLLTALAADSRRLRGHGLAIVPDTPHPVAPHP